MKLNKELAAEAKAKGICDKWYQLLRKTEDKNALIKMFLEGIDFCISEDYPSLKFFDVFDGIRQRYGIFRDEKIEAKNPENVVAYGKCEGVACYSDYSVGQIFLKHESKLTVNADGNSFIMIDILDKTGIEINASGNAKVCVNKYGDDTTIVANKNDNAVIKIIEKK